MSTLSRTRISAAFLAMLGLAACGTNASDLAVLFKSLPGRIAGGDAERSTVTAEQMAASLQATANPVTLIDAETRGGQFLIVEIQRNGAYRTYAASSRQTITFRDGIMVATRGFGGDLMSSEADALAGLVSARRAGTVSYVHRTLTADDRTVTRSYTCAVAPGGAAPGDTGGQLVTATCSGDGETFEDVFVVDRSGAIIGARQWLGSSIGIFIAQPLRR